MSTRISDQFFPVAAGKGIRFAAFGTLFLAACGGQASSDNISSTASETPSQTTAPAQPQTPTIACAPAGNADLASICTIERTETATGVVLTLRHPDGAFRRLQITQDGRGVIAADGAEPAKVTPLGPDRIEVELGGARYRLPAVVRGSAP